MSNKINLVLLYGGKSGEHEVSLVSAASVLRHLNSDKYCIIPVAMDKEGQFHLHEYSDLLTHTEKLPVTTEKSQQLPSFIVNGRISLDADVVFPVVHGPLYEDGCLQGMLELAGIAYVGSDVLSSSVSMDKDMARRVACVNGLKSARYKTLSKNVSTAEKQQFCANVAEDLGWPLFVKPCTLGSSVGIQKVHNVAQLTEAVDDAFRYDEEILVEQHLVGREIEISVLENKLLSAKPKVSIAGEIKVNHPDGFYSYAAKYIDSTLTDLIIPAPLSAELMEQVKQVAAETFVRLKCRGMARVDFFVNDETNDIYFNEINTLPGFTAISMYPKLWQASGLDYPDLLDDLIDIALLHQQNRQQLVTNYL